MRRNEVKAVAMPVQTLRLLLLEDDPLDADSAERALRGAGLVFETRLVDAREPFVRALAEFRPDVVVADYMLPAFDGRAALEIVRRDYPGVPVIIMSGALGDEQAVELIKAGASDFVLKDRPARLGEAVHNAVDRARAAAERDRMAEELRRHADDLERKVAERTAELSRRYEELETAMRAKDMFLANMSHELRTPLNAIIGFTGTLLMKLPGPLNAEQEKQLDIIQNSARHQLSLINDLLDVAKIESGKVELQLESLSCREMMEDAVATLRPLADGKGLAFAATLPPPALRVAADRRALRQILLNLGNNAIKFTDAGSVTIAIAETAIDGRAEVEVSVTDTGIGIEPERRDKLFEAFAQLDSTHREGTGLGLHLSRKLVGLLRGRIGFDSEPGRGSRFWFTLPRG